MQELGIDNYVVYHLHSDLSNGVTNIDSVTKYHEYIDAAKELGMKALCFTEHGSVFEWLHKKMAIEAAGMKYVHGVEAYITFNKEEKVRDNYHCVLIAKNYDGFLELNRIVSNSFNREDNHFYYTPRVFFDELINTSNNIIVTTACIGGVLSKGTDQQKEDFIRFLTANKDRCFLEIGHHPDKMQVEYNKYIVGLSRETGLRMIAGTDTHALNDTHIKGRAMLQKSKDIHFSDEDSWDLQFRSLEELVDFFRSQGVLSEEQIFQAINNTNVLADMVEEFELDKNTKYPHIYDNPEKTFYDKIISSIEKHPYILKNHTREEVYEVAKSEFDVYRKTKSIDFMLLQTYLREWEKENGIECGYGRGSVSGSEIAYILGITEMDSIKHNLNFFRFMNPSRVTNADIDTDYSGKDRATVKQFLLRDKMNLPKIKSAEIITFNTIALNGAIRDVCKGLYKNDESVDYLKVANQICSALDSKGEDAVRQKYKEVFEYVDIVNGTIVSIGTHPSGVLISDLDINESVGLCTISSSPYPVSMLNMKELDELMYVKLDILGLDNIGVINDTCKMAGIERLTPDNVDTEDEEVWKSIRDDTTLIFQWESNSAQQYIKRFMSDKTIEIAKSKSDNFNMMKWLSFGNGLLRPACASFRDYVADGVFYDNGFDELNKFLAPEAGRIAMQETIMKFLVNFCGYSDAESDSVRRAIAKKKGTETLLPEIERRFIDYSSEHYDITRERCEEVIKPFIQIILDASAYGFSWNHSDSYSFVGYISGYLRYYYPLEFLTAALNIFDDNQDKTAEITKYASRHGIKITSPKFGISSGVYAFNREKMTISKGLSSIKYLNATAGADLYRLGTENKYDTFMVLLNDISEQTAIDKRQIDVLIKIDFFSDFGNQRELMYIADLFYETFKKGKSKQVTKSLVEGLPIAEAIASNSISTNKDGSESKSYRIIDIRKLLNDVEAVVKASGMNDIPIEEKVKNFAEATGYVGYISGEEIDRRKLYISDIYELKRKSDGKQFGYSFVTKSIGSGKEARFSVFNSTFKKCPVVKGDIISCNSWEKEGKYFKMTSYSKLNEGV